MSEINVLKEKLFLNFDPSQHGLFAKHFESRYFEEILKKFNHKVFLI